jgi:hypothetical protein
MSKNVGTLLFLYEPGKSEKEFLFLPNFFPRWRTFGGYFLELSRLSFGYENAPIWRSRNKKQGRNDPALRSCQSPSDLLLKLPPESNKPYKTCG